MNSSLRDDRIRRAEELIENYDFARDLLKFYREILIFQNDLYDQLSQTIEHELVQDEGCPFHGGSLGAHLPFLVGFFPPFLSKVKGIGTPELAQVADRFLVATQQEWAMLLESYWAKKKWVNESMSQRVNGSTSQEGMNALTHLPIDSLTIFSRSASDFPEGALLFFPKAFLQPYAELLADHHPKSFFDQDDQWAVAQGGKAACPLCGHKPQLSILRTEGEGARRSLLCSLCATEWRYKRVCCPACGEERFSKLSYHKADDFPHVRVEVCESCTTYSKSVDLTVDGRAIPTVDEVATLPLDIWAVEQGYSKIEMNLVGM